LKISFCTFIRDRLYQYRQTALHNAQMAAGHDAEFCLADMGSQDGLLKYVNEELRPAWTSDAVFKFRHWTTVAAGPFSMSRHKNAAHRMATGDIVVSLDCDNLIGPKFCEWLKATLGRADVVAHAWTGNWIDGTYGRIAMRRSTFDDIGGYDEDLLPACYEDTDLIERARASGRGYVLSRASEVVGGSFPNPVAERMKYCDGLTEGRGNSENAKRSKANIAAGRWRANVKGT
jgi:hypothetical protein